MAGNGKQVFIYYNGECVYANRCDVGTDGFAAAAAAP
jgi:hypothetical protein